MMIGKHERRCGYTLLEVLMASTITATALIGSMVILRDGLELSRVVDERSLLANYASVQLEFQSSAAAATWTTGTFVGSFVADGRSDIRYTAVASDQALDGGIPNRLMNIVVTTYVDRNGNSSLDADETQCTFRSKIAKLTTYVADST